MLFRAITTYCKNHMTQLHYDNVEFLNIAPSGT